MAKSIANFDEFKRGIVWRKNYDAWSGSFGISKTEKTRAMCYSVQALPGLSARSAKPDIAERLFQNVKKFCEQNNLSMSSIIKQRLIELNKE